MQNWVFRLGPLVKPLQDPTTRTTKDNFDGADVTIYIHIDSIHTPASCTWFISEFLFRSSFFDSLGAYGRENIS